MSRISDPLFGGYLPEANGNGKPKPAMTDGEAVARRIAKQLRDKAAYYHGRSQELGGRLGADYQAMADVYRASAEIARYEAETEMNEIHGRRWTCVYCGRLCCNCEGGR